MFELESVLPFNAAVSVQHNVQRVLLSVIGMFSHDLIKVGWINIHAFPDG
jgi:hypothetical protein